MADYLSIHTGQVIDDAITKINNGTIDGYVTDAEAAAKRAETSASISKKSAENAKKSEDNAKLSADRAELATTHAPKIQNGTWWIWNTVSGQYEDSKVPASGAGVGVSFFDLEKEPFNSETGLSGQFNWPIGDAYESNQIFNSVSDFAVRLTEAIEDYFQHGTPIIFKHADASSDDYALFHEYITVTSVKYDKSQHAYFLRCSGSWDMTSKGGTRTNTGFSIYIKFQVFTEDAEFNIWQQLDGIPIPPSDLKTPMLTKGPSGNNLTWKELPKELPEGGTDGQILTQTSSGNPEWKNASSGTIPSGGTEGQVLIQTNTGVPKWDDPNVVVVHISKTSEGLMADKSAREIMEYQNKVVIIQDALCTYYLDYVLSYGTFPGPYGYTAYFSSLANDGKYIYRCYIFEDKSVRKDDLDLKYVPTGGTDGQVLTQTANGDPKWATPDDPDTFVVNIKSDESGALRADHTTDTILAESQANHAVLAILHKKFNDTTTPVVMGLSGFVAGTIYPPSGPPETSVSAAIFRYNIDARHIGELHVFNSSDIACIYEELDVFPKDGSEGQVLTQTSSGTPRWSDAPSGSIPTGGIEGQVLTKSASGDTEWKDIPKELPLGGNSGQVLTQTTSGMPEWNSVPGGIFVVNLLGDGYTADKNSLEIIAAIKKGQTPLLFRLSPNTENNSISQVLNYNESTETPWVSFRSIRGDEEKSLIVDTVLTIDGNGDVQHMPHMYKTLPSFPGTEGQVLTQTSSGNPEWKSISSTGGDCTITVPTTVTVGSNGNYSTLNEAIKAISEKYPVYQAGGLKVEVKILSGTTISEQISVIQTDLQFITITSEDAEVPVNSTGWTANGLDAHDLRGDVAFIGGENAAKLPTIGCLFKLTVSDASPVVGYFANRGSNGVILANCGFDGFNDGVIANNESSVTAREAICRNMKRWGIHARHNGEISARSINVSGAGDIAVYADRIADIDIKNAILDNSKIAIMSNNSSRINAQRATAMNVVGDVLGSVQAASVSVINADKMTFNNTNTGIIFAVQDGSTINTFGMTKGTSTAKTFSQTPGVTTKNGIIYSDIENPVENQFCVSDGLGGTKFITLGDASKEAL